MTFRSALPAPFSLKAACLVALVVLMMVAAGAEADADAEFIIPHEHWQQTPAPCLLAHNQGVDAIAEYRAESGELLLRAGSWLGRDGRYLLPPPEEGETVRLQLTTGQAIQAGQVALEGCPDELPPGAVNALVQAQDLRLAAYFGEPVAGDVIEQSYESALHALAQAQPASPDLLPILALTHYEAGAYFRGAGRLAEAHGHYVLAAAAFEALADETALAAAVNAKGLVAWRQGELDGAVAYFERALAIRQTQGDLYGVAGIANNLGLIHARRSEPAEAVDWYEIALSVFQGQVDLRRPVHAIDWHSLEQPPEADMRGALNTLGNLALVLWQQGQVDLAELYWRNYMALEAHVASPVVLARARLNFAQLLGARGRLDEALWQLTAALGQFEAAGERRWIVESLTELSALYQRLGDPAGALAHAREAAAIELEDVAAAAVARHQLGQLLLLQGEYRAAATELARAVELAGEADSFTRRLRIESDLARARFLSSPSADWLTEQRRIYARFIDLDRPAEAATILSQIGEMQFLLGDLVAAGETLEQAITGHRAVDDPLAEFQSLELLGRVLAQLDAMAAIETNRRAIALAEALRHAALPTLRQAELFASLHEVYRRQVGGLVEAGHHDEARALAKLARSRQVWESASPNGDGNRADLLAARADVLDRLHRARLDQRLALDPDEVSLTALQRQLDGIETALASMAREQANPARPAHPVAETKDWTPGTVKLSYFLLDDRILLWITSSDGTRLAQLDRPQDLAADIAALQDWLRHPRRAMGWIDVQAARLGEALLAPAAADLAGGHIVLVQADDLLHGLPFGLLHWTGDDDAQPLLESHVVQMIIGQAAFSPRARSSSPASSLLLVADPGWSDGQGKVGMLPEQSLLAGLLRDEMLAELPGSRIEAETIASRAGNHMPVRLRTGPEASREFMLSGGLADYRIIHLATHGLVDLQYPMLSSLLLASENAAGPAFLRPSEIAGLRLSAELVVLSGCETGHGRIVPGSGALSLAQPFLGAGAAEVLASLWKIDDARTARFMDRFYQHLLDESLSPAEALARTQRWTRRQAETTHPYYWAGFILLSEG